MATTGAFVPLSLQTLLDRNGAPIIAGRLLAFDAGTTNPRPLYADVALSSALTTPVLTDGFGRWPAMFADVGAYKVVIQDSFGGLMGGADGLPGGTSPSTTPTPVGTTIPTGFVMPAHTNDVVDGWLPLNALTIGNATSAATARANADTSALFIKLWNKDPSLPVSGGRGVSATADFNAAKTIGLPDYRGRTVAGCDGMGSTLAGVLTALSTATPNQVGTTFGAEAIQLSAAQLPAVAPTITIAAAGGFTPAGTLDAQNSHSHTGTTDTGGSHAHVIETQAATAQVGGTVRGVSAGGLTDQSTDAAGTHVHTFTTGVVAAHTHNFTGTAVAAHTHTATSSNLGSGAVHANTQPTILVFWHIKL